MAGLGIYDHVEFRKFGKNKYILFIFFSDPILVIVLANRRKLTQQKLLHAK